MRRFWRAMTCALGLAILATQAPAQTYPAKPVRIIVPYAPGGLTDVVARLYSEQLRQRLGRSVFVESPALPESSPSRRWRAPAPTATRS
jgi:tripartite-type tricarboxylate transporter receptor subunit TctC